MMIKEQNRKVIFIPQKNDFKYLKDILNNFKNGEKPINILFSDNSQNDRLMKTFVDFKWQIIDYTKNIDEIRGKIYQILILKDYKRYSHLIPLFIERIQRGGLIVFVSDEISINKNEVNYKLGTFSRRLMFHLQTKIVDDIIINANSLVKGDLLDLCIFNENNLIDFCRSDDQKHAVTRLMKTYEKDGENKSVTLLCGGSGRGKSHSISLGLTGAIENDIIDIFILSFDDISLNQFCDNLQKYLVCRGHTDVHIRRQHNYFVLEVIRGMITHKVRFLRFDQPFTKYDVGLLCIIEGGRLPYSKINKLLSYNPKLVWVTTSNSGANSSGKAVIEAMIKPLRSFCGVAETLPNNVENTTTNNGLLIKEIFNNNEKKRFISIYFNSPIIYNFQDPLESTINDMFCLNYNPHVKVDPTSSNSFFPAPIDCEFMFINKDTLFSAHPAVEMFLARFMEVYTSFDHKRQSNFLQQLTDDSSHQLFCLQQPSNLTKSVPQILCILHVCFEEPGLRIVNLITNKNFQHLGYGKSCINSLHTFLSKPNTGINTPHIMLSKSQQFDSLELIDISALPKLLTNIVSIPPLHINIDYMSCRFIASYDLICFWKKCSFLPVKVEPVSNSSLFCSMLRDCSARTNDRIDVSSYIALCENIGSTFLTDLGQVDVKLAHEILFHKNKYDMPDFKDCGITDITNIFDSRQLKKLASFVQNIHSFDSIQDLVYYVAVLYFSRRLPGVFLPKYQELALVGVGLQLKSPKQLAYEIVLMERYKSTNINDPFNLNKEITQKTIPLLLTHVRECVRMFLIHITKVIERKDDDNDVIPEKKRRLV